MREIKINLGSGLTNKKEGYLNIDIDGGVDPDITADIRIIPWIWVPNGIVTLIEMNNVLEHFEGNERINIVKECHHHLAPNRGKLWLKVPFIDTETKDLEKFKASLVYCCSDWTHKFPPFTLESFDYCDMNHSRWQKFGKSYGIPKFKRLEHRIKDRFLIVTLEAVK